ncbi:hypothetical protein, partial [Paenibacillus dendritiformis]|uniref:hypothetical protein n=1 Tax=Paenibacillus dendritiformis TaxID=130049 RepID=UPI001B2FF784
ISIFLLKLLSQQPEFCRNSCNEIHDMKENCTFAVLGESSMKKQEGCLTAAKTSGGTAPCDSPGC